MATIAAIGEEARIQGLALAGAIVCPAEVPADVLESWQSLGAEVAVVILTRRAADSLSDQLGQRPGVLTVVMPP